ncbi:hypothetical protein SPURM210S_00310 [Streptomyces purpurascens]
MWSATAARSSARRASSPATVTAPGSAATGSPGRQATRGSGVIVYAPAARSRRTDWGRMRRHPALQVPTTPLIRRATDQA